jgi:GWxTD domain-containing protein
VINAQPGIPKLLYSDIIQFSSDSASNVYYSYKIPLNHLVFEKEADLFLAQYRISVEVFDADHQKFITRAIKEKNIQVPDYEQTMSPLIFSEGILKLDLSPGTYSMIEIFYDSKSDRELKLPPHTIKIDSAETLVQPLIINDQTVECNNKKLPVLTNYGGDLPFDEHRYSFILPVKGDKTDTLYVNVIQADDTLFNDILNSPVTERVSLSECAGKILLDTDRAKKDYNIFRIDGLSNKINEGIFRINVSTDRNISSGEEYLLSCRWIDKPESLRDPELAIKALKFIESDSVISSLLEGDDENYSTILAKYWKKIDPTPGTEFNPLMKEFYDRIDYAVKNFKTIGGSNGANTDRGKVYIKFGKPIEVNRTSDNYGNIIETWTYNNPQRKFVFVDKKGTGEFSLISG